MDGFWFWLGKELAELALVLGVLAALVVGAFLVILFLDVRTRLRKLWRR